MRTSPGDGLHDPLVRRVLRTSGDGAFSVALTASGLLVAGYVVAVLDALGGLFTWREPGFRWLSALAWLLAGAACATVATGAALGVRAAVDGRRRGWAGAAICLSAVVLPLSVAVLVMLARYTA